MKNFFKRIFCTKYRIYPIYGTDNKLCGHMVYEKSWCSPIFLGSTLDTLSNGELNSKGKAAFKTKDEAIDFIKARTTNYTYETIQAM